MSTGTGSVISKGDLLLIEGVVIRVDGLLEFDTQVVQGRDVQINRSTERRGCVIEE